MGKEKVEYGYSIHGGKCQSAFALDKEGLENILLKIIYGEEMSALKRLYSEKTVNAILDGFETYLADHYTRTNLFKMGVYGNIKIVDDFIRHIGDYVDSEFITTTVYTFTEEDEKQFSEIANEK